jgi:hypothetical protein
MPFFRAAALTAALLAAVSPFSVRADPMMLSLSGTAFGVRVNETIDVSHGFNGLMIPLTNTPIAILTGNANPAPGTTVPLNSSFLLFAGLTGLNGTTLGANEVLSGTIQGSYGRPFGGVNLDGTVSGSGTAGNLILLPGATSAMLPPLFAGLSASVSGSVTGGGENLLQSRLVLTPGTVTVPEPSSALVALALTAIGLAACRRCGVRR